MKKLLFLSILIASSAIMTSCTADPITDSAPAGINAEDTGGQGGQLPPPPPPPPKPGVGIGG
ncbi:hypothetical protein [Flavobacterium sp.]|uniref:hypothetical protein n=1 Tax=Flavobacterium sp. TaxID=239 RepID=UPI0024884D64|nr:hypothetical protein [Flavobacterium sp.]MDI1315782.1 hypothetical protein [Flavobacterium sp.]